MYSELNGDRDRWPALRQSLRNYRKNPYDLSRDNPATVLYSLSVSKFRIEKKGDWPLGKVVVLRDCGTGRRWRLLRGDL
jgi:hypothetical protein